MVGGEMFIVKKFIQKNAENGGECCDFYNTASGEG